MSAHNDLRNLIGIWMSEKGFLVLFNTALVGRALTNNQIIKANGDGRSDILAIAPNGGRFWGVEVKIGNDRLRKNQTTFKQQVEKRGGVFIEARSLLDVQMRYDVEIKLFD